MNTAYLLILLLNGQAAAIEVSSASECHELMARAEVQIQSRPKETKDLAICLPKLGGLNKKS